jgi:hypothetical protein
MPATIIYRVKTITGASGATGATGAPTKGTPLTNLEIDNNFYNLTTEVDTKLGATGYNAADVLTKIKTVDGAGSGLDADTVDGLNPTTGWTGASGATGYTPSNIVARDALGNFTAGTITANLVGTVTGSVSGNAGTVTNGVVTSGSYSNPSWITALAGSKVTSIPNTSLTNSTITINGNGVALGGSVSLLGTDGTWTGTQTFYDDKFVMIDNVDVTKKLNFQLSNIANATTRTLTVPNENGVIATQAYVGTQITPVTDSIASLSLSTMQGLVPVASGGTALTSAGTAGGVLISNGSTWTTAIITGAVSYFAGSTAPTGWLKANGAAISRTTYAALFSVIGTTYGVGDNSTTFNLPDLRGEFIRSWDDGRGIDSGRTRGSAQGDAMRNISGTFSGNTDDGATYFSGPFFISSTANSGGNGKGGQGVIGFNASLQVPTASENRPRNISLLACIKF